MAPEIVFGILLNYCANTNQNEWSRRINYYFPSFLHLSFMGCQEDQEETDEPTGPTANEEVPEAWSLLVPDFWTKPWTCPILGTSKKSLVDTWNILKWVEIKGLDIYPALKLWVAWTRWPGEATHRNPWLVPRFPRMRDPMCLSGASILDQVVLVLLRGFKDQYDQIWSMWTMNSVFRLLSLGRLWWEGGREALKICLSLDRKVAPFDAAWASKVCWWVCFQWPTLGRLGRWRWGVAIRGAAGEEWCLTAWFETLCVSENMGKRCIPQNDSEWHVWKR